MNLPDFLLNNVNIIHLTTDGTNYKNAASTNDALVSNYVDMLGWEGVVFVVLTGDNANTATLALKVSQCDTSGGSYTDLTGTSSTMTCAASDKDYAMMGLDVRRPGERYLKTTLTRATANTVIDGLIAIQYGPIKAPITQGTGTAQFGVAPEKHLAPAEGTA